MKNKSTPPIAIPNSNSPLLDGSSDSPVRFLTPSQREIEENKIRRQIATNIDSNSTDEDREDEQIEPNVVHDEIQTVVTRGSKTKMLQKLLPSTLVAVGTGLAMMPIFNHLVKNSEDFGIDIHSDDNLFAISTANTFIVASFSSFSSMYHFIKKHQEELLPESQSLAISIGKVGASCSIILPLGLLWGIELQNQQVANSSGFDKFIAWASFTTGPLLIDRIVESIQAVDNIRHNNHTIYLDNIGSKLVVYGLAGLSVAGRVIAYTEAAKTLSLAMGMSSEVALGVGIAGGLISSGGITLFEYNAIKSLFAEQTERVTVKKAICGLVSALEGAWFTLPIVSLGLNLAEDWNPLLKGILFTPLFVSHTVLEATKIYNNVMMSYDTISEGISSLGCYDPIIEPESSAFY